MTCSLRTPSSSWLKPAVWLKPFVGGMPISCFTASRYQSGIDSIDFSIVTSTQAGSILRARNVWILPTGYSDFTFVSIQPWLILIIGRLINLPHSLQELKIMYDLVRRQPPYIQGWMYTSYQIIPQSQFSILSSNDRKSDIIRVNSFFGNTYVTLQPLGRDIQI